MLSRLVNHMLCHHVLSWPYPQLTSWSHRLPGQSHFSLTTCRALVDQFPVDPQSSHQLMINCIPVDHWSICIPVDHYSTRKPADHLVDPWTIDWPNYLFNPVRHLCWYALTLVNLGRFRDYTKSINHDSRSTSIAPSTVLSRPSANLVNISQDHKRDQANHDSPFPITSFTPHFNGQKMQHSQKHIDFFFSPLNPCRVWGLAPLDPPCLNYPFILRSESFLWNRENP